MTTSLYTLRRTALHRAQDAVVANAAGLPLHECHAKLDRLLRAYHIRENRVALAGFLCRAGVPMTVERVAELERS